MGGVPSGEEVGRQAERLGQGEQGSSVRAQGDDPSEEGGGWVEVEEEEEEEEGVVGHGVEQSFGRL